MGKVPFAPFCKLHLESYKRSLVHRRKRSLASIALSACACMFSERRRHSRCAYQVVFVCAFVHICSRCLERQATGKPEMDQCIAWVGSMSSTPVVGAVDILSYEWVCGRRQW
jgi:hypothetical protein